MRENVNPSIALRKFRQFFNSPQIPNSPKLTIVNL